MFIVIKSEHYDCTNLICKKDTLEEAVATVKDSMAQRINKNYHAGLTGTDITHENEDHYGFSFTFDENRNADSGIALCTVPFSDIWDSACIGFAVANINDFMKQRISDTPVSRCEAMHRAEDCIRNELEAYSDYLAGNCWQYCITDEDGNVVDSCSGFIGDDLEKNGMLNYICDYIEE